jgi:hypothetical protein
MLCTSLVIFLVSILAKMMPFLRDDQICKFTCIIGSIHSTVWFQHMLYTVNPALLASSFVKQIQLYFLHISLFKIIKRKYFIQSKCEFTKLLFGLLDKIKSFPLYTVYLPHQLLHMLFLIQFRNF